MSDKCSCKLQHITEFGITIENKQMPPSTMCISFNDVD